MKFLSFLFCVIVLINLTCCLEITEFSIENHPNENLAVLKCIVDYGEYDVSEFDYIFIELNFGGFEFCEVEVRKNRMDFFSIQKLKEFSVDTERSNRTHIIIKNINNLIYENFGCVVNVKISSKNKEIKLSDEKKIYSILGTLSDTKNQNTNNIGNKEYIPIRDGQLNEQIKLDELINEINEKKSKNQLNVTNPFFLPYYTRLNLEKVFRRVNQLEEKQMNETEKNIEKFDQIKDKLSNIDNRIDNSNVEFDQIKNKLSDIDRRVDNQNENRENESK